MKIYWAYFWYVIRHKRFYFKRAFARRQFVAAFTHDLSKFLPSEFAAYARYFYGTPPNHSHHVQIKMDFDRAWLYHQRRNKHHWNYWVKADGHPVPMPEKYIIQMVCDWEAMALRKSGNSSALDFWLTNEKTMILHPITKRCIEGSLL